MKKKDLTRLLENRATKPDRPRNASQCRRGISLLVETACKERGHRFVFRRGDRYGCCKVCGEEVLT